MNWIFEGPWAILLTAVVLEAILVIALVRTGRLALLWAIVGLGILAGALLIAERAILTDSERIRQTLDGIAAAAAANDLNGIYAYVAPEAEAVRRMAADGLRQVKIQEAWIGADLESQINRKSNPPTALATFTGHIRARPLHDTLGHEVFIGRFKVGLIKQGEKWLVTSVDRRELGRSPH
jgi:hypothetical protein